MEKTTSLMTICKIPEPQIKPLEGYPAVQVQTKLPYEEVLALIETNIQWIHSVEAGAPYITAPLRRIIFALTILDAYTNIAIDLNKVKTAAELYELYDLAENDLFRKVAAEIEEEQFSFIQITIAETLESLTSYHNSARGVIDTLEALAKQDKTAFDALDDYLRKDGNAEKIRNIIQATE